MLALVAVFGAATAFFGPAFDAIVPDVLPAGLLPQANSLDQFVRPIALRLAGPGDRRLADRRRRRRLGVRAQRGDVRRLGRGAARDGADRAHGAAPRAARWAATSAPASPTSAGTCGCGGRSRAPPIAYLLLHGPGGGAAAVRRQERASTAAPRISASSSPPAASARSACAAVMGQRGIPRRDITFMYLAWTLATVAIAGYGLATAVWQLMLASLAFNALETAGTIVWATAKQRHVPPALLGRVSSLDWLISIGLLPLSFALTGPGERCHRRRRRR